MAVSRLAPVYDDLLDYLVQKATAQDILAFHVSEAAQQRADELLDRQDAGVLTPDEQAELEQMAQFDRLVGLLKAKALAALDET